jgi:hypothetical protein
MCLPAKCWAGVPSFTGTTIDRHAGEICYAVTVADVDGDRRPDIVVATENRVLWYQAPNWTKRVIIEDQTERDNVCIAAQDIDGDGQIDLALGAGWTKVGTIQWLARGASLDEHWIVHAIGIEPWTHRMRWADVLDEGRPQLVVSPLNAAPGQAGVRLTAFRVPQNPRTDPWPRVVVDNSLNRMHNHWHDRAAEDGAPCTLTASQEGIHRICYTGEKFEKTLLHAGMRGDDAMTSGAGEIKTGKLASGSQFITTIEPMHGTNVVVYARSLVGGGTYERRVIDDRFVRGHGLWTADLDSDGADEVIAGHSDQGPGPNKGPGVYVYEAQDSNATKWNKHVVDDGGMATEDLLAADVTGDGLIDIIACGRATHNVKLYVNGGK